MNIGWPVLLLVRCWLCLCGAGPVFRGKPQAKCLFFSLLFWPSVHPAGLQHAFSEKCTMSIVKRSFFEEACASCLLRLLLAVWLWARVSVC